MTFEEAVALCPIGLYIKTIGAGWNEYHIQYGKDASGRLFWTAGGTAGGILSGAERRKLRESTADFGVYNQGFSAPIDIDILKQRSESI